MSRKSDESSGEEESNLVLERTSEIIGQNLASDSDAMGSQTDQLDNKPSTTSVASSNSSADETVNVNQSGEHETVDQAGINKVIKTSSSDKSLGNLLHGEVKNNPTTNLEQQITNPSTYKKLVGQPVKLIEIDPDTKQIVFFENELKEIFERNDAQDKMICVCSIAGDYRKGKSFLLNYCLRFLMNNQEYLNKQAKDFNPEWLGHVDEPLNGFSWRSGVDLETTGIWIWSEMFPCKVPKSNFNLLRTGTSNLDTIVKTKIRPTQSTPKEELYDDALICLVDSQGAFDEKSTISDCAMIFSILFLISSMQIYNVFHQLQEDNLHYLQLFTEYGRLIYEEGIHCKPFQRLTFLIRDWFSPSQYDYGNTGGEDYLTRKFKPEIMASRSKSIAQHRKLSLDLKENLSTRRHIQRCFDKIDCFLLPHPGKFVSSSSNYNGNWGDMQFEFCLKLKEFVEWWFSDLQVKRSTDYMPRKLTGNEFIAFFKILTVKLSEHNNQDLKPITLFESMSKISHIYAMEDSSKQYQHKMDLLFGSTKPFVWPHSIEKISKYLEEQTKANYLKRKKFGNRQFESEFVAKLDDQFKETRDYYLKMNELKCTVLPAYLLIICTLVFTHIIASTVKMFISFWLISRLIDWCTDVQLFFLFWAICVELFNFKYGSAPIGFLRRRLQCLYHMTRAKRIDLSILSHLN